MIQTAQIKRLETRKDLEALLPGDVVEVKRGITGKKNQYAFERILYDKEEVEEVVSFLRKMLPDGRVNYNLRIPQTSLVIDDGCVCCIGVRGHWYTKNFPGDEEYKSQRRIIEQSGL